MVAGLILALLGATDTVDVFGFTRGEAPIDVRSPDEMKSVASCAACHEDKHAQWARSRHARAWTNPVFAQGFRAEPLRWCVNCHAPLAEQAAQVDLSWYRDRTATLRPRPDESRAEEGVGCPTCHVRDGVVLVPTEGEDIHPSRYTPALRSSEMCAGCHEFRIHDAQGRPSDVPMQSTYSEWRAWGGGETCQDCHMPGGDHGVRGVYDLAWLRASVRVTVESDAYVVESVGVGHAFPTGDVFRHLTLEEARDGGWVVVAWFGRTFRVVEGPRKEVASDTSLRPGVPVRVPRAGGAWRLRYHYTSDDEEARRTLPPEDAVVTLLSGVPSAGG